MDALEQTLRTAWQRCFGAPLELSGPSSLDAVAGAYAALPLAAGTPGAPEFMNAALGALFNAKDWPGLLSWLDALLTHGIDLVESNAYRGMALLELSRFEEAEASIWRAVLGDPRSQNLELWVEALSRTGREGPAQIVIARLAERPDCPDSVRAHYQQLGVQVEAFRAVTVQHLQQLQTLDLIEGIEWLSQAQALEWSPTLRQQLTWLCWNAQRLPEVITYGEAIAVAYPDDPGLALVVGLAALKANDPDTAQRMLALEPWPNSTETVIWKCQLLNALGRQQEAAELLRVGGQAFPDLAPFVANLALECVDRGQMKRADELAGQALHMAPELPLALYAAGYVGYLLLRDEASAERLERAWRAEPSQAEWASVALRAWMGVGQPDRAVRLADAALLSGDVSPELGGRVVQVFCRGGRAPDALAVGQRLIDKHPTDPWSWGARAIALGSNGDPAAAEHALKRALDFPPLPEVVVSLAQRRGLLDK